MLTEWQTQKRFFPTFQWKIKFESDRVALKLKNKTWQSVKQFVNQNHALKLNPKIWITLGLTMTSQNIHVHNSTSMWNAIFLLCLFLIKIQNLYVLMVIMLLGCNCNKRFEGIFKWNVKMFRYNHVDKMICYELPVVWYKSSNWGQF